MEEKKVIAIHKFFRLDKNLYKSLIDNTLWFSKPSEFNDPFDCNFEYIKCNEDEAVEKFANYSDDEFKRSFDTYKNKLGISSIYKMLETRTKNTIHEHGICCFCKTQNNLLLWSHYADSHKGLCLTFDFNKLSDVFKDRLVVKYESEYPAISLIDIESAVKKMLSTKSKDWDYEKEVRFIEGSSGAHPFPIDALLEITFGLRMSNEDKKTIMVLVYKLGYQNAKFYESRLSKSKFELDFFETYLTVNNQRI